MNTHLHRDIVDSVLSGTTPEERSNMAKSIAAFALAALARGNGPDEAVKAAKELAETIPQ
jgi:hypothetical protein